MADSQSLYWQCPECGQAISDLQKRSFVVPSVPCGGCGRSVEGYEPKTSLRECNQNDPGRETH
jgi:endogenous inhibitor of DNA gyrase (YacG/DUF329 family)